VRVAFGSDEETPVTTAWVGHLRACGHTVTFPVAGAEWPEVGRVVGEAVARGDADLGVVCCWTGTGVSIAANKVPGVRAALCADSATAAGARRWNDANVVAIGLRLTTDAVGREILDAFLAGAADAGEAATVGRVEGGAS